ncbi:MAG: hypothetical protein KGN00_11130 [Chloroflexota bacterium]|nr:hypothetical protein [Chloroflexota bacterium]MDE3194229.1 hypothetical protein [Chloroflexota bacterium]
MGEGNTDASASLRAGLDGGAAIVAELTSLGLLVSQDGHVALDPRVRELAAAFAGDVASPERGRALRALSAARRDAGEIDGALEAATEAEYVLGAVGDPAGRTRAQCAIGQLQLEQGHLTDAQRSFVRVLDASSGADLAPTLSAQAGLVEIRARRGDTADAVDTLVAGMTHARSDGLADMEAECAATLAFVQGVLGDGAERDRAHEIAATILRSTGAHRSAVRLQARIGEQLAMGGDVPAAEQALRTAGAVMGARQDAALTAAVAIARGTVLDAVGDLGGAFACYWEAVQAARAGSSPFLAHKARILSAQLDPDPVRARSELRSALVALARERDREPFLRRPALAVWIRERLDQLGLSAAEREQVEEILSVPLAEPMPSSIGAGLQVSVLGTLEVRVGGVQISDRAWRTSKAKELFSLLLFRRGHPLRRDEIIERLWPECEPASGISNFHFTLHALRRALASTGVASAPTVQTEGGYQLVVSEKIAVDVDVLELLLHEAERCRRTGRGDDAARLYRAGAALYRADLLAGLESEWIADHREDVLRRYLSALRVLAELDLERDDAAASIASCRAYLEREPYDEHVHRLLMGAYRAQGDAALVERHYRSLTQVLQRELGARPERETTQLYEKLRGKGGPAGVVAPVRVVR